MSSYSGPPTGPVAPPPSSGPTQGARVLVALVIVFALVAGLVVVGWQVLSGSDDDPVVIPQADPSATLPPAGEEGLAGFYAQKLTWKKCGRNFCTRLTVPMDYDDLAGPRIKVAVLKVPAQQPKKRIGALVVNPGGPGGSGVQFAAYGSLQFGVPLSDRFDIVGFDPRGVGESAPLTCGGTGVLDRLLAFDPDPDDQAERDGMDTAIKDFGDSCVAESGELAQHISTKEVVKDLDILRAALGESKLDYLGSSYGTFIGATYAEMFPDRVGRFVLDGAVNPALSNADVALEQAGGFETALRAYLKDCVDQGGCVLGDSVEAGLARIQRLYADLDEKPLPTSNEKRPLTEGLAMMGTWFPLYVRQYWPGLTKALTQAIEEKRGTDLLALADSYSSRGPDGYTDNSMAALYGVNCLDHGDFIATKDVPAQFARFLKTSPTFGRAFAFSLSTCASWPVKSGEKSVALHAKGAPPIVVVGTTRDPATPLRWAQALASQLDSGTLITRDGDGHTGFQRGNDCVDSAVENFLIKGKVPRADLKC